MKLSFQFCPLGCLFKTAETCCLIIYSKYYIVVIDCSYSSFIIYLSQHRSNAFVKSVTLCLIMRCVQGQFPYWWSFCNSGVSLFNCIVRLTAMRTSYRIFMNFYITKLRKQLLASSCLSFRMSQWTDFHGIWYLSVFQKYVEQYQVSLKSEENHGHFTWRPIHIFDHISLSSS
jgi:hypothetical protein